MNRSSTICGDNGTVRSPGFGSVAVPGMRTEIRSASSTRTMIEWISDALIVACSLWPMS